MIHILVFYRYFLEDSSAHMLVDLTAAKFHIGMFTEFTFVLAEGQYDDANSVFKLTGVGLPPAEPARITRNYFGNGNFFGGPAPTCVSTVTLLKDIEMEKQDAMFVFVSGTWRMCMLLCIGVY